MTRKAHILVVDDEPNVLTTYRLILELQGYRASAATSSLEALEALARGDIDLLLCDLSLERQQSGFDVVEYARTKDPNIPCALLTGYANTDAIAWAEQHRIPILFKPIDIRQLLQTITELLDSGPFEKTGD